MLEQLRLTAEQAAHLQESLNRRPKQLKFDAALEAAYSRYFAQKFLLINRVGSLLAALALCIYAYTDLIITPEVSGESLLVRALLSAMILSLFVLSDTRIYRRHYQIAFSFGTLLVHMGLLYIGTLAARQGETHYEFSSIMSIVFFCTLLRLQFRYVLPFTLVMTALTLVVISEYFGFTAERFSVSFITTSMITIIILMASYRINYEHRQNFIHKLLDNYKQTELEDTQEQLRLLSRQDALTQIANRRYLNEQLAAEWRDCMRYRQPLSLLMIDIDHFKQYNDRYGHQAGDHCIRTVADRLKTFSRRNRDLVARFGGEEFLLMLPDTPLNQAEAIAEKIRHTIEQCSINQHPGQQHVTASIGVACQVPHIEQQPEALVSEADQALYAAKANGRNQVVTANTATTPSLAEL